MIALEMRGGGFAYEPGAWVFRDVNVQVRKGEVLTVLGKNGAGKSTLLNCLLGLLPLGEGSVAVGGQALDELSHRERARRLAYVAQQISDAVSYEVFDYVLMGRTPYVSAVQAPRAADIQATEAVLEELGLTDLAGRPVSALSGGQRQRVAIARALVQDTPVIVLDEPTSALDVGNQVRVLEKLHGLARAGYTVVHTTHNPEHALLLGGTVALVDDHSVVTGPVEEMMTSERLSSLFGTPLSVQWYTKMRRKTCLIDTSFTDISQDSKE